jgi:hypothetical protein
MTDTKNIPNSISESQPDTVIETDVPELSNYNTLVLSGGSVRGIAMLGALQYAYDNFLLV